MSLDGPRLRQAFSGLSGGAVAGAVVAALIGAALVAASLDLSGDLTVGGTATFNGNMVAPGGYLELAGPAMVKSVGGDFTLWARTAAAQIDMSAAGDVNIQSDTAINLGGSGLGERINTAGPTYLGLGGVDAVTSEGDFTAQKSAVFNSVSGTTWAKGDSTLGSTNTNAVRLWGHERVSSGTPVISACGTTPTLNYGNDMAGKVTTGTVTPTTCTLTFANGGYGTANVVCMVSAGSSAMEAASPYVSAVSATAFTITWTGGLNNNAFYYRCTGVQ